MADWRYKQICPLTEYHGTVASRDDQTDTTTPVSINYTVPLHTHSARYVSSRSSEAHTHAITNTKYQFLALYCDW